MNRESPRLSLLKFRAKPPRRQESNDPPELAALFEAIRHVYHYWPTVVRSLGAVTARFLEEYGPRAKACGIFRAGATRVG
jgi:hypothetical protein